MVEETRMLGGRDLAETLTDVLREWSARTGVAVEIWALPDGGVSAPLAKGAEAALREALANVERFSGARTVSVAVTRSRRGLRMTVSDDGGGTPWEETRLRAIFAELGGKVTVNHVPGEGTTMTAVAG
ncbi:hypothetical protein [Nonomuraea sp. NPDC050310]|uniref:hypothetical protein n=1 Tax=unclassified Nonomuraea TaxID=2593643 RepID=UPI0033F1A4FD